MQYNHLLKLQIDKFTDNYYFYFDLSQLQFLFSESTQFFKFI
jgi:hypothetical protein